MYSAYHTKYDHWLRALISGALPEPSPPSNVLSPEEISNPFYAQFKRLISNGVNSAAYKNMEYLEKLAVSKIHTFIDGSRFPHLRRSSTSLVKQAKELAAGYTSRLIRNRFRVRLMPENLTDVPQTEISRELVTEVVTFLNQHVDHYLTHGGRETICTSFLQQCLRGEQLLKQQLNSAYDWSSFPRLHKAMADVISGTRIKITEMSFRLLQESTPNNRRPRALLDPRVEEAIQQARKTRFRENIQVIAQECKTYLGSSIETNLAGEDPDLIVGYQQVIATAIDQFSRKILRLLDRQDSTPAQGSSPIEKGLNIWTLESLVGPAASFAYIRENPSGLEIGFRLTSAAIGGPIAACGTEAIVRLMPLEAHQSRLSRQIGAFIPSLRGPLTRVALWTDKTLNCSNATKETLLQGSTALACTAVIPGGFTSPYQTTAAIDALSRVGHYLGLIDGQHFTNRTAISKQLPYQLGLGIGTTLLAEYARCFESPESALAIYAAGNLLATPKAIDYVVSSKAYDRVQGEVASVIYRTIIRVSKGILTKLGQHTRQNASTTPVDESPLLAVRLWAWVTADVEEKDLWF